MEQDARQNTQSPQDRSKRSQLKTFYAVRGGVALAGWAAVFFLLYRYEYFAAAGEVDNFTGILPVILLVIAAAGLSAFLLIRPDKRRRAVSITLIVVIVAAVALFPNALSANWGSSSRFDDKSPDMSVYEPFTDGNRTAKLNETPTLYLTTDFPIMDGARALYPLYAAIAETVYDRVCTDSDYVMFTDATDAYDGIIAGERDVIFVAGATDSQKKKAADSGVELVFTPICKDALVFSVGADNPINNITYRQIRNIYSGKTTKWKTLGWAEGGDIIALRRPEGADSHIMLERIMSGLTIAAPRSLPVASAAESDEYMRLVSLEHNGVRPVLGYSYKFAATELSHNPDTKLLSVDGVAPETANIRDGSYPFTAELYAVTNGEPTGTVKALIDWILSEQGRRLIEAAGYSGM